MPLVLRYPLTMRPDKPLPVSLAAAMRDKKTLLPSGAVLLIVLAAYLAGGTSAVLSLKASLQDVIGLGEHGLRKLSHVLSFIARR